MANQTEKQKTRRMEEILSYTMSDGCHKHHWPQEVHANLALITPLSIDTARDRPQKRWAGR